MPTTFQTLRSSHRIQLVSLAAVLLPLAGCSFDRSNTYEVEVTDYSPPPTDDEDLKDDTLSDKTPPEFDASLVDRRPLEGWLVNSSAAVLQLDVPLVKPDQEPELLVLHPSYAAALGDDPASRGVLPSVNLIDGKAKQFDDGLCAALDQAYFQGIVERLVGHAELVRRLLEEVDRQAGQKGSPAAPFLAAALELAGLPVQVSDERAKEALLTAFEADETASKPIGFYTWNRTLERCFRFHRFLQHEFGADELKVPLSLARALEGNEQLSDDYRRAVDFYARLTNPQICASLADLMDGRVVDPGGFAALCEEKHVWHPTVAFFPPASSREAVLFEALFPRGLPKDANLMQELVRRIRGGEVDLTPKPASGWYDHQVFALESMLLPDVGQERNKLLLSKAYKRRMLDAFQALLTKRRETHVRDLAGAKGAAAPPPAFVRPRLRVEPAATYYFRTARAYRFLTGFLESALGRELLAETYGLKKDGPRPQDLWTELNWMRDLFYGLYLVSAEDIGLHADALSEGDSAEEADRCYQLAVGWLDHAFDDPDLATDTRVSVPIAVDRQRGVTRLWATLGVRLTRLTADYARPPSLKPAEGEGEWSEAERVQGSRYLIPVDEFAEVELNGLRVLTREELRLVCDRAKTKQAILKELESR